MEKTKFWVVNQRSVVSLTAMVMILSGCGGGGDDPTATPAPAQSTPPPSSVPAPTQEPLRIALEKSSYTAGDTINIATLVPSATSATIIFENGQTANIPILSGGNIITPVAPKSLIGKAATISVQSPNGSFRSEPITLQWAKIPTSTPGVSTLIYLAASLVNVNSSIDELITISGDTGNQEAMELSKYKNLLMQWQSAVKQAQTGQPVLLSQSGATPPVYMDTDSLEMMDQFIMATLTQSSGNVSIAKAVQDAAQKGGADRLSKLSGIATLDCTIAPPPDQAWCANMRTQIANDLIINYAGVVGTSGQIIAGALGALTALGVISAATPALLIGVVSTGLMYVANGIAGSVQGASAYGTGTSQGTNVANNIKNMVDLSKDLVLGQISKLFPNGGSELIKQLNGQLVSLAMAVYQKAVDKLISDKTLVITQCLAQASSGGQGSFARRYDFLEPHKLRVQYNMYSVPDEMSVYDGNGFLGGTAGLVSGTGSINVTTTGRFVTVKVNAPNSGTAWEYTVGCAQ